MANYAITGARIAGIVSAVPAARTNVESNAVAVPADLAKIVASTGVKARHIAPAGLCTSDLCASAAENLLEQIGWNRASIDLLILVTQTPDYLLPATACSLHGRLGLPKTCSAFDINLGCSGYVYGLSVAATHVQAGAARRVLLLVGDTITKLTNPADRSVSFLFGDAGTATAIEASPSSAPMHFVTGSDGAGASHLQVPAGMFRSPSNAETRRAAPRESGNVRSDEQLFMNGPEIFNFTIREVPGMLTAALQTAGWKMEDVDAFVFHQANRFMLEYLAKRMKLPGDKVLLGLEDYGNTSSASIPLTLCHRWAERSSQEPTRVVLAGFGVGFSWAAVALQFDRPKIGPVVSFVSP